MVFAGQILDQLGTRAEVIQRLTGILNDQGGGEAGHEDDQALVQFDRSPNSNHPLLVLS